MLGRQRSNQGSFFDYALLVFANTLMEYELQRDMRDSSTAKKKKIVHDYRVPDKNKHGDMFMKLIVPGG